MTRRWSTHATDQDSLFSRHLLPLKDAVSGQLLEEAALPPLHRLGNTNVASISRAFHLACQSVHVIALSGPAITATLSSRRRLSLIYVESGELELQHPQHPCFCTTGTWVLVPGCSLIWKSSAFRVICILMSPEEIALNLESGRPDSLESPFSVLREGPRAFHSSTPNVSGVVVEMLTALLNSASQLHAYDPALLERLVIGDQVRNLVAVLIDPKSASPASTDSRQQALSHEKDHFDSLIRYIKSNLHQPLNLTVLANESHYSRRTLQYAFRNRLGCTATQWIRNQRLDLAWQLLQAAGPGDNVTRIAQSCGYRSLSLFSIEFQHRFHIKPSVLLRSTRDNQGAPGPKQDDGKDPAEQERRRSRRSGL
jgi:AraC-like DNA-binding protein